MNDDTVNLRTIATGITTRDRIGYISIEDMQNHWSEPIVLELDVSDYDVINFQSYYEGTVVDFAVTVLEWK